MPNHPGLLSGEPVGGDPGCPGLISPALHHVRLPVLIRDRAVRLLHALLAALRQPPPGLLPRLRAHARVAVLSPEQRPRGRGHRGPRQVPRQEPRRRPEGNRGDKGEVARLSMYLMLLLIFHCFFSRVHKFVVISSNKLLENLSSHIVLLLLPN